MKGGITKNILHLYLTINQYSTHYYFPHIAAFSKFMSHLLMSLCYQLRTSLVHCTVIKFYTHTQEHKTLPCRLYQRKMENQEAPMPRESSSSTPMDVSHLHNSENWNKLYQKKILLGVSYYTLTGIK